MSDITYNVGVLLGRSPLSEPDQNLADLLVEWVESRIDTAATAAAVTVDPVIRDQVTTKAVARYMGTPRDGLTQRTVQVDDAQITNSYGSGATAPIGEVEILSEWWADLGLSSGTSGTFSVRPSFEPVT